MDWQALWLSLSLAFWTVLVLLPVAVFLGRFLAYHRFRGKGAVEALVILPLVLPPTVLGFYLLVAFGAASPVGRAWEALFGAVQPAICHPARPARLRSGAGGGARGRGLLRHVTDAGAAPG